MAAVRSREPGLSRADPHNRGSQGKKMPPAARQLWQNGTAAHSDECGQQSEARRTVIRRKPYSIPTNADRTSRRRGHEVRWLPCRQALHVWLRSCACFRRRGRGGGRCVRADRGWRRPRSDCRTRLKPTILDRNISHVTITDARHCRFGHRLAVSQERSGRGQLVTLPDDLIRSQPVVLWPKLIVKGVLPRDVETLLLAKLG